MAWLFYGEDYEITEDDIKNNLLGYKVEATQDVKSLGISFTGLPPGYPAIKKVVDASWAESVGVLPGFVLFEVNGLDLADMSKDEFMDLLKSRPLVLYFEAPTPPSSEAEPEGRRASLQQRLSRSVARPSVLVDLDRTRQRLRFEEDALCQQHAEKQDLCFKVEAEARHAKDAEAMFTARSVSTADLPGKISDEKVVVLQWQDEWERLLSTESAQFRKLRTEVKAEKAAANKTAASPHTAAEESFATEEKTEAMQLRSQLQVVEAAINASRKQRKLLEQGDVHAIMRQVEARTMDKVEELKLHLKGESGAMETAQRRDVLTTFKYEHDAKIACEQEVDDLNFQIHSEASMLKALQYRHVRSLGDAQESIASEQEFVQKAEKHMLAKVRFAEADAAKYTIDKNDPEIVALQDARQAVSRMEFLSHNLHCELQRLESFQKSGDIAELSSMQTSRLDCLKDVAELEEHIQDATKCLEDLTKQQNELEDLLDDGKTGPLRLAADKARRDTRHYFHAEAQAEALARARQVALEHEMVEAKEIRMAWVSEMSQAGRLANECAVAKQESGRFVPLLDQAKAELKLEEAAVGKLDDDLVEHAQRQRKAEILMISGSLGQAELGAWQHNLKEENALVEAEAKARDASRTADQAELSALRAAFRNEEAAVLKLSSRTPQGRDAAEIRALKAALAREEQRGTELGVDYHRMQSEAAALKAHANEVAALRGALLRQEREIGRLQQFSQDQRGKRNSGALAIMAPVPERTFSDLEATLDCERALALHLHYDYDGARNRAEAATLESAEVAALKASLAAQQQHHGALQTQLLQQTGKRKDDTGEVNALRSELIIQQTEVRMLRDRPVPHEPQTSISPSPQISKLQAELISEEAQLHALQQRSRMAIVSLPGPVPQLINHPDVRLFQVELSKLRSESSEMRQMLITAPVDDVSDATSGKLNDIALLKAEIAKARRVGAASVVAGPHIGAWTDFKPTNPMLADGPGFIPINPQARYNAVISGDQISQLARQVEAAEFDRLEEAIRNGEISAAKSQKDSNDEVARIRKLKNMLALEEAEASQLKRVQDANEFRVKERQTGHSAELAQTMVGIAREEAEVKHIETRIAAAQKAPPIEDPIFNDLQQFHPQVLEFEESAKKDAERDVRSRRELDTIRVALAKEEAAKDNCNLKLVVAEAQLEVDMKALEAAYTQELVFMKSALELEEGEAMETWRQEHAQLVAGSRQATIRDEEMALIKLRSHTSELAQSNAEMLDELREIRSAMLQETVEVDRARRALARCFQDCDRAELQALQSDIAQSEQMAHMKKSLETMSLNKREMEFLAADKQHSISSEAKEFAKLKPQFVLESDTAWQLRTELNDTESKLGAMENTYAIQQAELNSLRSQVSTVGVDASFGRHENLEVNALRAAISDEQAAMQRLRRDLDSVDTRMRAAEITQEAEVNALKTDLKRAEVSDDKASQAFGRKNLELAQLEASLRAEERAVKRMAHLADEAVARGVAAENTLWQMEQREMAVISYEVDQSTALIDAKILMAEANNRILEEHAALWCSEALEDTSRRPIRSTSGVSGARTELLQRKLDRLETEAERMERRANATKALEEEAAELKKDLAFEIFESQKANLQIHKARHAESQVLQNALQEVNDSVKEASAAMRLGDEMKLEVSQLTQNETFKAEELDDLRIEVARRAGTFRPVSQPFDESVPKVGKSLNAMLKEASNMLGDTGDVADAMETLMLVSSSSPRRSPSPNRWMDMPGTGITPVGTPRSRRALWTMPASSESLTGGVWKDAATGELTNQASSLRVQADSLRDEIQRFKSARVLRGVEGPGFNPYST